MRSPFLRLDDPNHAEILTDAFVQVLHDRGLDRFSVGAVARWMKVTPAAVLKITDRATVVALVTRRFGDRWLAWIRPEWQDVLPARLPATDDEVHGVKVWNAIDEFPRSEAIAGRRAPEQILAEVHEGERAHLAHELHRLVGRPPAAAEVVATAALVDGLRRAVAGRMPDLTYQDARAILAEHLSALRATGPLSSAR